MSQLYRALPAVDAALKRLDAEPDLALAPRPLLRRAVNDFLDHCRESIRQGRIDRPEQLSLDALEPALLETARKAAKPHFCRVLNATGVVVHTNLGRSLLADCAIKAVAEADAHYSNLEFDLATGGRGSRYSHVVDILRQVTGAEDGLVVNNNAAAVLLVLNTLAQGKEVIVSRGQLVEIGGSFRIPDVMTRSGAILREVGATNRTHLHDYANAVTEETAALLKVHASNFRIVGFTKEVSLPELVQLGRERGLPVIEDLGSGNFFDFRSIGFAHEPTVQETVATNADVITFSGDKVLGGPQAGIIVGRSEWISRIKQNPMNRALRIDKMTLAALEATLRLYLEPERAREEIPTLRMITTPPETLKKRAQRLARRLRKELPQGFAVSLAPGVSRVGGGSFPERDLATTLVRIDPSSPGAGPDALKNLLLEADPPLVGRIEEAYFCLDPRTLDDGELPLVSRVLAGAATQILA